MKLNMDLKFTVGGREVSSAEFERALTDRATKLAEHAVERRLASIRCPVHGQTAQVTQVAVGGKLEWQVRGCCQRLIDEVKSALR